MLGGKRRVSKNTRTWFALSFVDGKSTIGSRASRKADCGVTVLSDCMKSHNMKKMDEMLRYYESKGSEGVRLSDV
jgi:hypothetical protein